MCGLMKPIIHNHYYRHGESKQYHYLMDKFLQSFLTLIFSMFLTFLDVRVGSQSAYASSYQ